MAVGTAKVGGKGTPRGLEGQALLNLIQALADPALAQERLERLAAAEAAALDEREAADAAITETNQRRAEAGDAEGKATRARQALADEQRAATQRDSDTTARLDAEHRRLETWAADLDRRGKTLAGAEARARAAAQALAPYLEDSPS